MNFIYYNWFQELNLWLAAQALMNPQAVLGLLVEGARSNFWGLACPSYCTQPSWGLLLCCVLVGWLSGILCCLWGLCWFLGLSAWPNLDFARPSSAFLAPRAQLLASYLHEHPPFQSRRRSWTAYHPSGGPASLCFWPVFLCCQSSWTVGVYLALWVWCWCCWFWSVFWVGLKPSWVCWPPYCTCSWAWDSWDHSAVFWPLPWQVVFSLCSALWVFAVGEREDWAGLVGWAVGWCCAQQ